MGERREARRKKKRMGQGWDCLCLGIGRDPKEGQRIRIRLVDSGRTRPCLEANLSLSFDCLTLLRYSAEKWLVPCRNS